MNNVIGVVMTVLATLFVASVIGSLLFAAVHFGFLTPVITMFGVSFLVVTLGVGAISIMKSLELI